MLMKKKKPKHSMHMEGRLFLNLLCIFYFSSCK